MKENAPEVKKRSAAKIAFDVILAVVLLVLWILPIVKYVLLVIAKPRSYEQNLWVMLVGWAVIWLIQLLYDSFERRLFVKMFKGLYRIGKWNAESWFLQAFLWLLVYFYGTIISLWVTFAVAPASAIIRAVKGR